MTIPDVSDKQILMDNPHFEGNLIKNPVKPFNSEFPSFTHIQIVGCAENAVRAAYLWKAALSRWFFICN